MIRTTLAPNVPWPKPQPPRQKGAKWGNGETKRLIVEFIRSNPACTPQQIMRSISRTETTTQHFLKELTEEKRVRREKFSHSYLYWSLE
jgi:hypothetical protein